MRKALFPLQYEPGIPKDYTEQGSDHSAKLGIDTISIPDANYIYSETKGMSLKDVLVWCEQHKDNLSSSTMIVDLAIGSDRRFQASVKNKSNLNVILFKRPLNTIFHLNNVLNLANEKLEEGGYIFCHSRTSALKKQLIMTKYPWGINYLVYSAHFLWHRVCPKIKLTEKFYFSVTEGKNRTFHRVEILGRISRAGFQVVNEEFRNGIFFVIARKTGDPIKEVATSGSPIIRLRRVGKDGKLIDVYKFRTMYSYSEYIQSYIYEYQNLATGGKFANDYRVSKYGKIMRKIWLDELPMIYNLLKGDLKLVGVRPLSTHYFSLYTPEMQQLRVKAKPGLLPPFYYEKEIPQTLEEIQESERKYTEAYLKHPLRTDIRYFFGIMFNIIVKRRKSK